MEALRAFEKSQIAKTKAAIEAKLSPPAKQ